MAESEQGIHPEVMRHIVDLHRKHSELQMQMHDKGDSEEGQVFQEMLAELKQLNANLKELIPAVQADTKADLKEAGADKGESKAETKEGKNERRRERGGKAGVSGESSASA